MYDSESKSCKSICPEGEKYNEESNSCDSTCEAGEQYDSELKSCNQFVLKETNLI